MEDNQTDNSSYEEQEIVEEEAIRRSIILATEERNRRPEIQKQQQKQQQYNKRSYKKDPSFEVELPKTSNECITLLKEKYGNLIYDFFYMKKYKAKTKKDLIFDFVLY